MPVPIIAAGIGAAGSLLSRRGNDEPKEQDNGGGGAPWLGPAIGAGGSLVGALIGSRASGRAADTQLQATREALAFEREKERRAAEQWAARQARLAPFRMGAVGLLQKYYGPDFYAQSQAFGGAPESGPTLNAAGRSLAQLALQRRMGIGEAPQMLQPPVGVADAQPMGPDPLMEFDPEAWKNWRG